jgi:hypothetical protein
VESLADLVGVYFLVDVRHQVPELFSDRTAIQHRQDVVS